ncbi:hypothetical protein [Novosphingobium sp. MBES04]|uniref:hypothetical protein n=1 Tax=Novosphingobium sp. MBES04 TaxID=1206458 RepID=UPI00057CCEFD|nr:hypothetical protein [Novosphingobium sp. MBES04]GAM05828.1 hypothetical protein MBENS4_2826 [Novosphingobium sp. MBES04]
MVPGRAGGGAASVRLAAVAGAPGALDRQAGEVLGADSVSDLAERFDEVLALVSGLMPEADMVEDRANYDAVSPVLPRGREDFVAQGSEAMCRVVEDEWYAARAEDPGDTGDAPGGGRLRL